MSQNEKAIFSIVVPVFNASRTIERMLASFISNRDYIWEVILVNDNSTDDTFEKISQFNEFFNIKVINNPGSKGPGPARRAGIQAASEEWITFVDADDCLTASSLYYVYKKILENTNANIIKGKTISYESGSFCSKLRDTVGGNFYRREYIIEHELLPHESLFMAEDSYFMDLTYKYITYCDKCEETIINYEYPVYEVHHDFDYEYSFGTGNWVSYAIRYQLECKNYIIEFFSKFNSEEINEMLFADFAVNFIFTFHLLENAISDNNMECNRYEQYKYFKQGLIVLETNLGRTGEDIIGYYHECDKQGILQSAIETAGEFTPFLSFESFVQTITNL